MKNKIRRICVWEETMQYLLTGAEMKECDVRTSEIIGLPSLVLMERAALSVADGVEAYLKKSGCRGPVLAFAGRGNNGADALAAGRILLERGFDVKFIRLSGKVSADSSFAVQENVLLHFGETVKVFSSELLSVLSEKDMPDTLADSFLQSAALTPPSAVIDGLFGTGLSRPLEGEAALAVQVINSLREKYGAYVVAVDIPSGISSDDGSVMGCAVRCDETRTFAFYKRGHFMYPGASFAGDCHLAQIGITPVSFKKRPGMFTMSGERPADLLPARDPGGNKGTFGKVLIAAGRRGMCGAAILAAHACMASGAGMVKLFTHEANRVIVQQMLPEALLETWSEEDTPAEVSKKLRGSLEWADVAAAGPGMGRDMAAEKILEQVLDYAGEKESLRGLVLDADAIRLLADSNALRTKLASRPGSVPCILTPHLAEFAALAQTTVKECMKDRCRIVQDQADLLRCTLVCKDARTLIAMPGYDKESTGKKESVPGQISSPESMSVKGEYSGILYLNTNGNSGMATAGSGDVLTGITAAVLASFTGSRRKNLQKDEDLRSNQGRSAEKSISAASSKWRLTLEDIPGSGLYGFDAACTAVWLHGLAGDAACRSHGGQGMTARDLIEALRDRSFWQ